MVMQLYRLYICSLVILSLCKNGFKFLYFCLGFNVTKNAGNLFCRRLLRIFISVVFYLGGINSLFSLSFYYVHIDPSDIFC